MSIRVFLVVATLLAAFIHPAAAPATDGPKIEGKWSGQIPRPSQSYDAVFEFKVSGEKLTGTVHAIGQEYEINEGKIRGDAISFTIGSTSGTYTGKVNGDEIAMKVKLTGGEFGNRVMDFTLKRMKD